MATWTINVTQEDIDNGEISCACCPIALSLNRDYPIPGDWHVNGEVAIHRSGTDSFSLPQQAVQFIRSFDAGLVVEPFTVTCDRDGNLMEQPS